MPSRHLHAARSRLALALLVTVVAGCGIIGGGGSPAEVVRRAVALIDAKDFTALTELACTAERDRIQEQFNLVGGLGSIGGVDAQRLLGAVELDTSKVVVTETSVEGDRAEVRMSGTIGLTFDAERMKALMREIAQEQNLPLDENQLNLIIASAGALAQNVPVNQSLSLIREDGNWRICGAAGT